MTYFCEKCQRNHRSGKIYEKHLEFKRSVDTIPSNKFIKITREEFNLLPLMALESIRRHMYRMKKFGNKGMYIREINKILILELRK